MMESEDVADPTMYHEGLLDTSWRDLGNWPEKRKQEARSIP